MNRVPVGQTIARSFAFVFENYLPILGIVWLPMAVQGVAGYFVMVPFFRAFLTTGPSADPQTGAIAVFTMMPRMLLFDIVAVALLTMMSVGITRQALGARTGPGFIYYSFGATDLRVLGGYVLAYAICAALVVAVTLIVSIANVSIIGVAASGQGPPAAAMIVQAMLIFVAELAALYVWIRLSSFSTAVAVAERRFGLWRSWELTRGNVWRLFVIILTVTVPIFIVEIVVAGFTVGPVMTKLALIDPMNPQAIFAAMAALMSQWMPYLPYYWLGWVLVSPIAFGLPVVPAALAYRSLVAQATPTEVF
jgi:hypothetical protein